MGLLTKSFTSTHPPSSHLMIVCSRTALCLSRNVVPGARAMRCRRSDWIHDSAPDAGIERLQRNLAPLIGMRSRVPPRTPSAILWYPSFTHRPAYPGRVSGANDLHVVEGTDLCDQTWFRSAQSPCHCWLGQLGNVHAANEESPAAVRDLRSAIEPQMC